MINLNHLFCVFLLLATASNSVGFAGLFLADDAPMDAGKKCAKARSPGASSPEEAFEVFCKAVEKDDWTAAFEIQTQRSRDFLVGGTLAACSLGALGDDGTKLASTFGDIAKVKELISMAMKAPASEHERILAVIASLITRKSEFMSQVLSEFRRQKKENWLKDLSNTKLVRLKIKGDRASAHMDLRIENGVGSEPVLFERKDGRWYFDYFDN